MFVQAFRGYDIVGKLQGKCLDTRRIANSTKVQPRHRGQPISSGLLICVFVQAFGDAFEYAQVAVPLSLYITYSLTGCLGKTRKFRHYEKVFRSVHVTADCSGIKRTRINNRFFRLL